MKQIRGSSVYWGSRRCERRSIVRLCDMSVLYRDLDLSEPRAAAALSVIRAALSAGLKLSGATHLLASAPFGQMAQYLPSRPGLF